MDLSKEYVGKVIYNQDPTHTGRCKVKVIGLFDNLPDENIPWFTPVNSNVFSGGGSGSISVPKLNTYVRVKFSNDDLYSGEYTALQVVDPALVEEIKDDYDGAQVLLYDAEAELLITYQKMQGLKIYHKGSYILLDPTGTIQAVHQNNSNVVEINNDKIIITTASGSGSGNSTGSIDITSGSIVNITADTVNVKGNKVNIGPGPYSPAVNSEELKIVLNKLVAAIGLKMPIGPDPTLAGSTFANIDSKTVNITK